MSNLERIDYNGINVLVDVDNGDFYWTVEDVATYLGVSTQNIQKIIDNAPPKSDKDKRLKVNDIKEKSQNNPELFWANRTFFYNLKTLTWVLSRTNSEKAYDFQLWANEVIHQKVREAAGLSNPYHDPILEWDDAKLKLPGHKGEHLSEVQKRTLDYSKVLYPNKGKPWTIKEHDRIILMLKEKVDLIEIANQLDRTPRSLSQHINTYKLDELAKNQLTLFDIEWNGDDEDD